SATAATRATSRTERASARDSSIRLSIEEARDDQAGPGVQAEDKGPGGRAGGGMETPTMLDHNDTFPVKTSAQVPQAVGPRSSVVCPSRGWDPVLAALAAFDRPDGLASWPPPVTRSALGRQALPRPAGRRGSLGQVELPVLQSSVASDSVPFHLPGGTLVAS